ncbi:MAG TPA: prepilin-type N-terminal cleavage/methylation domain-containing protein [Solirubrobacterales bacterium]|nr:prepilin-type N-terminal cleavage/methylation domain-containing protein [Solirubrobacterales bacterium]
MARRLSAARREDGFTLIEMLVAMTMGVVVMGGVVILLIGAMRSQPRLDKQATNIQTARYALERMTREIRSGFTPDKYTASSVSFQTYVRHTTCGGSTMSASSVSATKCEVTYTCSGSSCTRIEAAPSVYTGTATTILTGIGNASSVFSYPEAASPPTYIEVTLKIPDPEGSGALTVSDGASLRNATLSN